jgi:molybdopterin molybdotransferase
MHRFISPEQALDLVLQHIPAPSVDSCSVDDSVGRVLAAEVPAPSDYPAFQRAMMDGFAVRVSDAGKTVVIVGEASAGHATGAKVEPGCCVEIMTGAPCPEGTEAVVPVENTTREGDRVVLPPEIRPGRHVQPRGQICKQGAPILQPGTVITPLVLGVLTSFGLDHVPVFRPPRVGVISTGDELVHGQADPSLGQIRDSNGPMLAAMARQAGALDVVRTRALDTSESLQGEIEKLRDRDLILLTGGVSMGRYDLVPRILEATGAEPVLHKIAQQPGKPLFVAAGPGRMFFGLPGNPRATHFCFVRYVIPAMHKWTGRKVVLAPLFGSLSRPYACKSDRTLFVPMRVETAPDGSYAVWPFDERGSADIYNIARANAYVRFAPGEHKLDAGARVPFFWMGGADG